MKRIMAFAVVFMIFFGSRSAVAQDQHFDPMERNLIFVEGEAEITIPINGFSLTFAFDIDKSSFDEASQESARIIDKISAQAKALGLSDVEIIKGWDVVKQAKISFASKGRKISNRLSVRVLNFPAGQLHELIAKMIDQSLSADGSVALEEVNIFISEELENQKKEEVSTKALKALDSNAARIASALGRKLIAPKRVFVTSEEEIYRDESLHEAKYYDQSLLSRSPISIQKSFKVEAQIVDHMKLSAKVSGIYQID